MDDNEHLLLLQDSVDYLKRELTLIAKYLRRKNLPMRAYQTECVLRSFYKNGQIHLDALHKSAAQQQE